MTPAPLRLRGRARQRGAALLTAMIIVTLVATLASAMVWQQWRAVQVESAERARVQSEWVLGGALDWARLILREDARGTGGAKANVDDLTEPWATPLAEARLSTFLAADQNNNATDDDDAPDAFLSGYITDAQSRYNLMGLVQTDPEKLKTQLAILTQLCENVNIADSVALQISQGLNAAMAATPSGTAPLLPRTVDQLVWFGLDQSTVAALAPYVTLLQDTVMVNINTAPREVIAAVAGVSLPTAQGIVQGRPFQTLDAAGLKDAPAGTVDVKSSYFEVHSRLRLADHVLEQLSLVNRSGTTVTVKWTQHVSTIDQGNR